MISRIYLIIISGFFALIALSADQYAYSVDRKLSQSENELKYNKILLNYMVDFQEYLLISDVTLSLVDAWTEGDQRYDSIQEVYDWTFNFEDPDDDFFGIHEVLEVIRPYNSDSEVDAFDKEYYDELYTKIRDEEYLDNIYNLMFEYSSGLSKEINNTKVSLYNDYEFYSDEMQNLVFLRQVALTIAIAMSLISLVTLSIYIKSASNSALKNGLQKTTL